MRQIAWAVLLLIPLSLLLAGCGRPVTPGSQFRGGQVITNTGATSSSEAPKAPFWEAGPTDAKVRILAFLYIDPEHKVAQDTLRSLAKQYQGKLYVKYVDFRTPEGQQIMQRANSTGSGLLVNGETTVDVTKGGATHVANFGGEMGRYWTADDIKEVVAQEVAKAYPGK
jgi:hypothetical protein